MVHRTVHRSGGIRTGRNRVGGGYSRICHPRWRYWDKPLDVRRSNPVQLLEDRLEEI